MAEAGFTVDQWKAHASSVCYHLLFLVLVTLGLTVLAMQEQTEASLAEARAQSLQVFTEASSLRAAVARLQKAGPATSSPSPGVSAAPSASPAVADETARRESAAERRERNDARILLDEYRIVQAREAEQATRGTVSEIIMLFALLIAPLALPTRNILFCRLSLALAIVAMSLASITYLT